MNHSKPSTMAIATTTNSLLSNTLPLFSVIVLELTPNLTLDFHLAVHIAGACTDHACSRVRFRQFAAAIETQGFAPPRSGWRQGSLFDEQDSPAQSKVYSQASTYSPQPQRFRAAQCGGKRCVQASLCFNLCALCSMQHLACRFPCPGQGAEGPSSQICRL